MDPWTTLGVVVVVVVVVIVVVGLQEHALKELSAQSATIIVNEDVRWVITVPAIWTAPAKQLMRLAAYEVHR